MSTPIGHALSSLLVSNALKKQQNNKSNFPFYLINLFAATIPDFTYPLFLGLGIQLGHRSWTHSLLFILPVAFVGGMVSYCYYKSFKLGFISSAICVLTHLILDMGSSLTGPMLFWPMSDSRIDFPIHFMPVAEVRIGSIGFNFICVLYEIGIFMFLMMFWEKKLRWISLSIFLFLMCGSIRQSNFRSYIWEKAPESELNWYLEHLDQFSPFHFSIFIDPNPRTQN